MLLWFMFLVWVMAFSVNGLVKLRFQMQLQRLEFAEFQAQYAQSQLLQLGSPR